MKIAVIGSGHFGHALGSAAAAAGYEVTFSATRMEHAQKAAADAGHGARAASVREAVSDAALVVFAVNFENVPDVIREAGDALKGKVVIDPMNAVTEDMLGLQLGTSSSTTEEVSRLAPEARVVKAFNTVFAAILQNRTPRVQDHPITVLYAGDDEDAKRQVKDLIEKLGFDAVDAGPAQAARVIDALGLTNIWLGFGRGLGTGNGFSLLRQK